MVTMALPYRSIFAVCLAALLHHAQSIPLPYRHSIHRHLPRARGGAHRSSFGPGRVELLQTGAAQAPAETYLRPAYQIAPVCQTPAPTQVLNMSAGKITSRVWKGWGTSLAWYANFLGSLPPAQSKPIVDLLFDKKIGLGLNIVRYNIPGGYNAAESPQFKRTDVYKWRAYTGFKSTATGPYNWSADADQRSILQAAKARGADTFTAFSSSPPWFLTESGDVSGNAKGRPNLRDNAIQPFANYLADVAQQFATKWDITFEAIEPFDQPTSSWKSGGTQEGCTVSTTQAKVLLPALAASLAKRKLATKVAAFNDYPERLEAWVNKTAPAGVAAVTRLSTNGYETTKVKGNNHVFENAKDYVAAGETALKLGKEIWVSEWGPDAASGSDLGVALYMARQIISSVNLIQASAWLYWQPLDVDEDWTLLGVNWDASVTKPLKFGRTKKFTALMQFAKTIPKGAVPVDLASANRCAFCIAAFFIPCRNQIVVTGVNQGNTPQLVEVNLDGFKKAVGGQPSLRTVFRTSATEDFLASNSTSVSVRLPLSVTLKGQSLTTLILSNVQSRDVAQNKCLFPDA